MSAERVVSCYRYEFLQYQMTHFVGIVRICLDIEHQKIKKTLAIQYGYLLSDSIGDHTVRYVRHGQVGWQ